MKKYSIWISTVLALALVVLCLIAFPTRAEAAYSGTEENISWTLDNSGVLTVSGNGPMPNWDHLGLSAWYRYRNEITSVVIMPGITSIGPTAFAFCTNIVTVSIPDTVTSIDSSSFTRCDSLISLTLPAGLTEIEEYAFDECPSLQAIYVDGNNPVFSSSSDGVLFDKNKTSLLWIPAAYNGNCQIPATVTSIYDYTFYTCTSVNKFVVASNNQTYSSDSSGVLFNKAKTTLLRAPNALPGTYAIPRGVQQIAQHAFFFCDKVTKLTLPASLNLVYSDVFFGNSSLTAFVVDSDNPYFFSDSSGALYSINGSTYLLNVPGGFTGTYTVPANVAYIDFDAFSDCNKLTAIQVDPNNAVFASSGGVLYNKVKNELIRAPKGYAGHYSIPNGIKSISARAFSDCTELTSVTIPDSVTHIYLSAFSSCPNLRLIFLGKGIQHIEYPSFGHCEKLAKVYYAGTQQQWDNISFAGEKPNLSNATLHFLTSPLNGWISAGNDWYHFKSGTMTTGWFLYGNQWYYLNSNGLMRRGFLYYGGQYYYLDESGIMKTGWTVYNGNWYYMNASGHRVSGIHTIGGVQHKFDANGVWLGEVATGKNGWMQENGKWYYYQNEAKKTGWLQQGNVWYYLKPNGEMAIGWTKVSNLWYYFKPNGAMYTGWLQYGGYWYYLQSQGNMATSWVCVNNKWYCMDENGHMRTGVCNIDGWTYWLDSEGVMQTGWMKNNNRWYYFHPTTGRRASFHATIGGKTYFFDPSTGIMFSSCWAYDDHGNYYYFGADGARYENGWFTIGSQQYYFDSEGRCSR